MHVGENTETTHTLALSCIKNWICGNFLIDQLHEIMTWIYTAIGHISELITLCEPEEESNMAKNVPPEEGESSQSMNFINKMGLWSSESRVTEWILFLHRMSARTETTKKENWKENTTLYLFLVCYLHHFRWDPLICH